MLSRGVGSPALFVPPPPDRASGEDYRDRDRQGCEQCQFHHADIGGFSADLSRPKGDVRPHHRVVGRARKRRQ